MKSGKNQKNPIKITELLAILSKPGSQVILKSAEVGFTAQIGAHLQMGLTKRTYYSQLSHLVCAGLIEKTDHIYLLTSFGKLVWLEYIPRLQAAFVSGKDDDN